MSPPVHLNQARCGGKVFLSVPVPEGMVSSSSSPGSLHPGEFQTPGRQGRPDCLPVGRGRLGKGEGPGMGKSCCSRPNKYKHRGSPPNPVSREACPSCMGGGRWQAHPVHPRRREGPSVGKGWGGGTIGKGARRRRSVRPLVGGGGNV